MEERKLRAERVRIHYYTGNEKAQETVQQLMDNDEPVSNTLELECQELTKRVNELGGIAFLEQEV